jgi:hypothetical protein
MENFSHETQMWLSGWLSGGAEITTITPSIIKELEFYSLGEEPIVLYRGLKKQDEIVGNKIKFNFYSSWTYSMEIADDFADDGRIACITVAPKDTLVDTTMISKEYLSFYLGGFPEEMEVIVNPGTYEITLV